MRDYHDDRTITVTYSNHNFVPGAPIYAGGLQTIFLEHVKSTKFVLLVKKMQIL